MVIGACTTRVTAHHDRRVCSCASAITGTAVAMDTVVICADRPSPQQRAARDPGMPERGTLLGLAED